MEIFLPARSPQLRYTPCLDCTVDGGWRVSNATVMGREGRLSVALDTMCYGLTYTFAQTLPSTWSTRLTINGTDLPSSTNVTRSGGNITLSHLPLGLHKIAMDLFPPAADPFAAPTTSSSASPAPASASFLGATVYTGAIPTAAMRNTTIDDSAWRNWDVILSPGWNMMETAAGGASNWLNSTQMEAETANAGRNWNGSLSWTEVRGANTTIMFQGDAVAVYGVVGGPAGRYEVMLDNRTAGVFNASGGPSAYDQILFQSAHLGRGNHSITLRNLDEGKRLSFDRLLAVSGLAASVPGPASTQAVATRFPSQPASGDTSSSLNPGAVAGIVFGSLLFFSGLVAVILVLLRKHRRAVEAERQAASGPSSTSGHGGDDSDPKTFFKWPRSSSPPFFRMGDRSANAAASPTPSSPKLSTHSKAIVRAWQNRRSGSWSFAPGAPKTGQSFVPGLDSPRSGSSMAHNLPKVPHEDKYTSFLKFSKPPKKGRLPISSPIPYDEKLDNSDGLTPALAAAISGRTTSPLAQLRNHTGDLGVKGSLGIGAGSLAKEASHFPQMSSSLNEMLARSPRPDEFPAGQHARPPSGDTIGNIYGAYGRDTMRADEMLSERDVGVAVSSSGAGWQGHDFRKPGGW